MRVQGDDGRKNKKPIRAAGCTPYGNQDGCRYIGAGVRLRPPFTQFAAAPTGVMNGKQNRAFPKAAES